MAQTLCPTPGARFLPLLGRRPGAVARIRGSEKYPALQGRAAFYQTSEGVLTAVELRGLPTEEGPCQEEIFALHIHAGAACAGDSQDPFREAGAHYNPEDCPHPRHAGDLVPLFGCGGTAFAVFLAGRFSLREILGRTVIVHAGRDDFTSQPGGAAGEKIACGEIRRC